MKARWRFLAAAALAGGMLLGSAACAPSGVTATDQTRSVCPVGAVVEVPVMRFQYLTVPSGEPETACVPSGATASKVSRENISSTTAQSSLPCDG